MGYVRVSVARARLARGYLYRAELEKCSADKRAIRRIEGAPNYE